MNRPEQLAEIKRRLDEIARTKGTDCFEYRDLNRVYYDLLRRPQPRRNQNGSPLDHQKYRDPFPKKPKKK